jgi:type IX secretion system PorP/SprF family membrane protein
LKKFVSLSLLYFILQSIAAQDHPISVFSSSPLTLNPGTTGTFGNSNLRVYAGYDWNSFKSFFHKHSMSISADKALMKGKVGVGGNIAYEFGDDITRSNCAMLSAAYNKLILNDNYKISAGLQAGLVQNSIDWDRLYYTDPLSASSGGIVFDSIGPVKDKILYPDYNLGIIVFRNKDNNTFMPWIGFSISHLFKPNTSFLSLSSPLPRKFTIHTGADITVHEHFLLTPLGLYTIQDYYKTLDLGGTAKYKNGIFSASLGGLYKNSRFDLSISQQLSLLAEIGYAGFELRLEVLVINDKDYKQLEYSRGMIGLCWNLQDRKN